MLNVLKDELTFDANLSKILVEESFESSKRSFAKKKTKL